MPESKLAFKAILSPTIFVVPAPVTIGSVFFVSDGLGLLLVVVVVLLIFRVVVALVVVVDFVEDVPVVDGLINHPSLPIYFIT